MSEHIDAAITELNEVCEQMKDAAGVSHNLNKAMLSLTQSLNHVVAAVEALERREGMS